MNNMEKKKKFIVNVVFFALIALIVIGVWKYVLPALIPFLFAFCVAALLQVPVRKLGIRHEKGKKAAAVLLCVIFYAVFFLLAAILGMTAVRAAGNLVVSAPSLYHEKALPLIREFADRIEVAFSGVDASISVQIEAMLQDFTDNMGTYISEFSVKGVKLISGGVAGIPGLIVKLVITLVSTFFIAADYDRVTGFFKGLLPAEKQKMVEKGTSYVKNVILIYFRSYSLLFLLTFVELTAGLLLLKIPYAVVIALAIAIFDILPVLGTGGILLPWAAVLFVLGNGRLGVGILLLYVVITIIRNTVEPKIVGKQIGLHPLATLVALVIGLRLMGIVGMILLPVSLAVLANLKKNLN